jgi:sodium/proline symporter
MQQMYPAFIAGIFLCAILAASMSTADSQLLAASSAVSRDVYKGIINKNADEKKVLLIGRITVVVIAAIALLLAFDQNSSVFGLVSYAWAGFGATLGPLILLSLYWKGLTSAGAIAGIIGGGITVVAWHQIPAKVAPIFGLYEIIPGFVVCFVLAVIVSMCIKNKNEEMLKEFDDYKKA